VTQADNADQKPKQPTKKAESLEKKNAELIARMGN
jgi:hypothetical protein